MGTSHLAIAFVVFATLASGSGEALAITKKDCENRHLSCAAACGQGAPAGAGVNKCLTQCSRNRTHCVTVLASDRLTAKTDAKPPSGPKVPPKGQTLKQQTGPTLSPSSSRP